MAERRVDLEREKQNAARAAVTLVENGTSLGLGSGSTVAYAIRALGERIRAGLRVAAVPSSRATERLALAEGITIASFERGAELDLTIDGADEVDGFLRMVKGGGGALLREKVVAFASRRTVIAVDSSKVVQTLGRFPLPVEVLPFAAEVVLAHLRRLGCVPSVRSEGSGGPFLTDQGNLIVDCAFASIPHPEEVADALRRIPGVLEHGLFLTEATRVLVGRGDTVEELRRPSPPPRAGP